MAYSTDNPPRCAVPAVGTDAPNLWFYVSLDAATVVRGADYITNALDLGMKVGDIVIQSSSDASVAHIYVVVTVDADGADLSDGTAIDETNT
jgi:hypothetical protein